MAFSISSLVSTASNSVSASVSSVTGSLTETTVLNALSGGSLTSILNTTVKPGYSITYNTIPSDNPLSGTVGSQVFNPTNWVSFRASADAGVVNAPVELGGYSSINKVRRPRNIELVFTLEGWSGYSGNLANYSNLSSLSRKELLSILESMRDSAYTYNIATPDTVYSSFDLERFDYSVASGNGMTLLTVRCSFIEVISIAETSTSTSSLLNSNSSEDTSISTQSTNSNTSSASLSDINTAYSSATGTTDSTTSASSVSSSLGDASSMVSSSYSDDESQSSTQSSNAVSKLTGALT